MGRTRLAWKIVVVGVALMSGALSLVREVFQFVDPSRYQERPVFFLCLKVAFVVSLLILPNDEYRRRRVGEKRWEDQRPCLGLEAISYDGEKTWREHNNPFTVQIKLLSGRVPTSVHFDPIPSKSGKFILQFDSLPHVDPPVPKILQLNIIEVGKPELSATDRETAYVYTRDMLLLFLEDTPDRVGEIDYPLVAKFTDRDERRDQTFHLRWDWGRYGFRRDTT